MLSEGAVDDLAMLIVDHYGVDKSEALNDIEIHGVVSEATDDFDSTNKYMKMITDVGAMATVGCPLGE
jgi:hypothetical protein